jgi:hypothetical protein
MLQDALVYIIIVIALSNAVFQSIKILRARNNNCVGCPNCGLKNQIRDKKLIITKKA